MIEKVVLRRFKRFHEECFDLRGHVVLAGPNNCGKTTVLQAVAAWALGLKTWQQLGDYQRHGGAYTKAPIARQAFSAVPLRSFDLLWKDRRYSGHVELEATLSDGRTLTMESQSDSSEQVYVRPKNDIKPWGIEHYTTPEVIYVATIGGLSRDTERVHRVGG